MQTVWQDVRYGLRMLAKNRGFSLIVILTLALGIGANTAIFSVINAVLLRPLPFKDPAQLVDLRVTENAPGNYPLTGEDYLDWVAQNRTFEAMSLYGWDHGVNTSGSDSSEPAVIVDTQANFFLNLGVQPLLGRTFVTGEDQPGKNHVAILNYRFWRQRFGGRIDAITQNIELNGEAYTVIGVMPVWFNFPAATDIWTPLDMSRKNLGRRGNHQWRAFGRVKPGTSIAQGRADLVVLSERLSKQYRDANDIVASAATDPARCGWAGAPCGVCKRREFDVGALDEPGARDGRAVDNGSNAVAIDTTDAHRERLALGHRRDAGNGRRMVVR